REVRGWSSPSILTGTGDTGGRARGGGCGRGGDRATEPLADQCVSDRDGAGRPDAAGPPVQVQLRTGEEAGFGDLHAVRLRGGIGGGTGEATHQRSGEGPRLGAPIGDVLHAYRGLFTHLAAHRLLQGLPRFDETGRHGEAS